jgi:hypothetical protein
MVFSFVSINPLNQEAGKCRTDLVKHVRRHRKARREIPTGFSPRNSNDPSIMISSVRPCNGNNVNANDWLTVTTIDAFIRYNCTIPCLIGRWNDGGLLRGVGPRGVRAAARRPRRPTNNVFLVGLGLSALSESAVVVFFPRWHLLKWLTTVHESRRIIKDFPIQSGLGRLAFSFDFAWRLFLPD